MMGSPFEVIHAHAWQQSLDVPSLNARVSEYIRGCIDKLRKPESGSILVPKSTALLLLGPAGSGKTHLFTRLRQQVGCRGVFVHTRPEIGVEPSPRHVLAAIVHSLRQPVFRRDERQIDIVVGTMLARASEASGHFPLAFLEDCLGETEETRRGILEKAIACSEDRSAEIWPEYLEYLLRIPFADRTEQRALWTWLAGGEPSEVQLQCLGRQTALRDDDVMMALRTLGVVASFGTPLVLVFDQLENLADDEGKTGRISQYARLVSELRDTVRGLVIVQMALDSVWMSRVHPVLQASMRDRLEERVEYLDAPTADERLALVRCWVNALPAEQQIDPFPYPFTPEQVDTWKRASGMTPRMLMQACGEAYRSRGVVDGDELPREVCVDERLEGYWQQLLQAARATLAEAEAQGQGIAAETIRAGLLAVFSILERHSEATTTDGVPSLVFQIDDRDVLVVIAQQAHHRALAKTLRTAMDHAGPKRVVVLRERGFAIPPTWKEVNRLSAELEKRPDTLWLQLDRESLVQLLALERLLTSARSHDFTDTQGKVIPLDMVVEWARKNVRCMEWPPVRSILDRAPKADEEAPTEPNVQQPTQRSMDILSVPCTEDGVAARELRKLKVASIERLVREIRATHPVATRASVMSELSRMRVKRFGASIVALEDLWA